jgi:isopenicillin N synthase-like dioxygenase
MGVEPKSLPTKARESSSPPRGGVVRIGAMEDPLELRVRYSAAGAPSRFARVIRETGFAVLGDHPLDAKLVAEVYDEWAHFFSSDEKMRYRYDEADYAGFYPYLSENAKDSDEKDLKEFFHLYSWSELPAEMSDATRRLFVALENLAATLLGWLDDETPPEVRAGFAMPLREMIRESRRTVLRILHYPPIASTAGDGAVRAAAHEDINLLTLLPAGTAPGLEVRDAAGRWHEVPCDAASLVVNAVDMLELASRGYFRSTTHRVVNPTGDAARASRYSMPLFLHPRPDVRLSPTKAAGEYLDERLAEIGLRSNAK